MRTIAEAAARRAGEALLTFYEQTLDVQHKLSARDVVSEADYATERIVVEFIRSQRPDDTIIGEEYGATGSGELTWGIDPLDGTSNFVSGIPHWCVCIGCEDPSGSVVGAIYDVLRGEMFTAARGEGTTLNGAPISGSKCGSIDEAVGSVRPSLDGRLACASGSRE